MAVNQPPIELPNQPAKPISGRISVMPSFYLPKAKKQTTSPTVLILVAVIAVALIMIGVVVFILVRPTTPPPPSQTTQSLITDFDEPEVEAEPEAVVDPSEDNNEPEEPIDEPISETSFIQIPEVGNGDNQPDVDTDQDGLTDTEEQLLGTNPALPDTDGDSFLDGAETQSLFDPATEKALLETSPRITIGKNSRFGYQFLMPDTWASTLITPTADELAVRPPSGSEEFTITVHENSDRLTVTEWFREVSPNTSLSNFINFKNEAGWNGIQSSDGRLVIATFGDSGPGARAFIFVMHYDPGEDRIVRYPTIWKMLVNSLAILEVEQDPIGTR